jgi:hypothetical protein
MMKKPPFKARNERDRLAFRDYVIWRLVASDQYATELTNERYGTSPPVPPEALRKAVLHRAKDEARRGDPELLRKIVSTVMSDPEIAEFISRPKRKRGQRNHVHLPFRKFGRSIVIDTVWRIKDILRQDFGAVNRRPEYGFSVEEIAGEIFRRPPGEIAQIMKKAPRRN